MQVLSTTVGELVSIVTGVIALYFFVSFVVNLAQAQVSTATGDVMGDARALQQGITSVILLAVAGSANVLVPAIQGYISPDSAPLTAHEAFQIWEGVALFVVAVVIGGTGILTTISVVFAGLQAQASQVVGSDATLAGSVRRLATLFVGGILTFTSVFVANLLVSMLL